MSSSKSSADSIARHFIQKYYSTLHNAPTKVPCILYSPFATRVTSYVSNGNNNNNNNNDSTTLALPPKEVQDSRTSLQSHFISKEKYYMDLNTTISSCDASEVTFVQDKTLLVLVKGTFSSSLGQQAEKKRRNFSQTFLLTTARGGGQEQQQQQHQQLKPYEFVCTNELLQVSCEQQIDKGVGAADSSAEVYGGEVKVFEKNVKEIERQEKQMVEVPRPPSATKSIPLTPRKQRDRQRMVDVPPPPTPMPAPRPISGGGRGSGGGGGRRTPFGDRTTKTEMKFIEKQIDALYTDKRQTTGQHRRFDETDSEAENEKSPPAPGHEKTKPFGDINLAEAKQQLLAELKQKKKPMQKEVIKQTASSHVVFVKNIHFHTPASAMRREFSQFGTIISIDFGFPKDDFAEERKKFCFIEYASRSECEAAVAQSTNVFVDGRRLIIQHRTGKRQQSVL